MVSEHHGTGSLRVRIGQYVRKTVPVKNVLPSTSALGELTMKFSPIKKAYRKPSGEGCTAHSKLRPH